MKEDSRGFLFHKFAKPKKVIKVCSPVKIICFNAEITKSIKQLSNFLEHHQRIKNTGFTIKLNHI